jgi:hypothetical protein
MKSRPLGILALLTAALAVSALFASNSVSAKDYRFMTGPQGGSWYPLGGAISNFVRDNDLGMRLRVMPGGGISNVIAVEKGKAQFGFGNVTSTSDAMEGRSPFKGEATEVRHLVSLYPQWFQFVTSADSGVITIADMAGRDIAVGPRGHSGEQASRHLLEVFGLSYDDLGKVNHVGYTDAVALLKDGHVDAFGVLTSVPSGAIMDTASARDINLLSVSDEHLVALQEFNPQYVRRVIPAGSYPGLDEDLATFGTWTHMIARADVPDEVVYAVVEALVANITDMAAVVNAMHGATIESLATPVGVPFHPGAARFFRERGVME